MVFTIENPIKPPLLSLEITIENWDPLDVTELELTAPSPWAAAVSVRSCGRRGSVRPGPRHHLRLRKSQVDGRPPRKSGIYVGD